MKPPALAIIALSLLLSAAAHAEPWTLTTAEVETRTVTLLGIDRQQLRLRTAAGEQALPLDRFVHIAREQAPAPSGAKLMLHLVDGQRLAGEPVEMTDERLRWRSGLLGEVVVPLEQVRQIARAAADPADPPPQDVVRLLNNDIVRGILADLSSDSATIMVGADAVSVPMESVALIRLAAAPGAAPPADDRFMIHLADGSAWHAADMILDGTTARLRPTGGADNRQVPREHILAIDHRHGPVTWLSSVTPEQDVQSPLLGEPWPAQMNRTVRGQPIRFAGQVYGRGIGVQAHSRLTWALSGEHRAFRTRYALDGDLPHGQVTVRILLDERVVHEQADFRSGAISPVITVDLGDAQRLALEVDYGGSLDVQARLNWIEPALLR